MSSVGQVDLGQPDISHHRTMGKRLRRPAVRKWPLGRPKSNIQVKSKAANSFGGLGFFVGGLAIFPRF
jgi:hypothetical protein